MHNLMTRQPAKPAETATPSPVKTQTAKPGEGAMSYQLGFASSGSL